MVVTIIAIILSTAAMNFFNLQNDARTSKVNGDLRVLKLAVETYCSGKTRYPDVIEQVENGPVLQALPKDPYNSNNNYGFFSSRGYFALWSAGPNGISGTVTINYGGVIEDSDLDDIGLTNGACPNKYWD